MSGYVRGILLVGTVFMVSAILCFGAGDKSAAPISGSPALIGKSIAPFELTRENGSRLSSESLRDQVWLAAFTFTRCPSSCPRISATLKGIQGQLGSSNVKIISFSVDPKFDTPDVLMAYGEMFGADPARWWFLTGPEAEIYQLIQQSFMLPVAAATPEQLKEGAEAVAHSERIALIDKDLKLVKFFDSNAPDEIKSLIALAKRRDLSGWVKFLPKLNATLNATSFLFLMTGWFLIRSGRWRAHAFMMITCLAISGAFLACYLTYHYFAGTVRFPGSGQVRSLYLSILLSHTILAVALVPMIALSVLKAVCKDFQGHKKIAQITFPVWVYISVTGVVIYLMLYELNPVV